MWLLPLRAGLVVPVLGIGAWSWGDRSGYWGYGERLGARECHTATISTAPVSRAVHALVTSEPRLFVLLLAALHLARVSMYRCATVPGLARVVMVAHSNMMTALCG